jgi:D-aminoacyl-tRNA deacylase
VVVIVQRVAKAEVVVDKAKVAEIGKGILAFLGIASVDDGSQIQYLCRKLSGLRIFADDQGKMNLSVQDVDGEILVVSQFTLCANIERGRRPDFFTAAEPVKAEKMYLDFVNELRANQVKVKTGIFGANMQISLTNDGPVTFILQK